MKPFQRLTQCLIFVFLTTLKAEFGLELTVLSPSERGQEANRGFSDVVHRGKQEPKSWVVHPITLLQCSTQPNPALLSYSTKMLLSLSCPTIITTWGGMGTGWSQEWRYKWTTKRAQRTKLAPLSKICKHMAAKQCFRQSPSAWLCDLISPGLTDRNRKEFWTERFDDRISQRERWSRFEIFLYSKHGFLFWPDEFKNQQGVDMAHGIGIGNWENGIESIATTTII